MSVILAFSCLFFLSGIVAAEYDSVSFNSVTVSGTNQDKYSGNAVLYIFPSPDSGKNKPSIVICPGGSYMHHSMDKEGYRVARWLNSIGVNAFVLRYRLNNKDCSGFTYPAQWNDASAAVRWVRWHATQFGGAADNIGIMGFSAGGHLASMVTVHWENGHPSDSDSLLQFSSRPDFSILIYPVIVMDGPYLHKNSRKMLTGSDYPDENLIMRLSTHLQVDSLTPPVFLVHADDDKAVPAMNSVLFYEALKKFNIPSELHIYQKGGHGFGLAMYDSVLRQWPEQLKQWMIISRFLNP